MGARVARSQDWSNIAVHKSVHTPEYKRLIAALIAAREQAELSQRDLAARLGVQPSWIAKTETCERRLDVIEFIRLARALRADPVKLFATVARRVRR